MVESLKELNKICQKPRYKEVGNWMVRHILRDAALPVTRLLLHTSVTANQVTTISLLAGLAGIAAFTFLSPLAFLTGAFLLQLWYFLDHVDGQIARYRGTSGLTGRFFDFLTHHIIHGAVFFGLGFYAFRDTGNSFFVLWGFSSSLAILMFNLVHDTKYKTFFERFEAAKKIEILALSVGTDAQKNVGREVFLRKGFSVLHKLCEIHVLMNLLTLAAVFQFWVAVDLRFLLFVFYGFTTIFIAVVKISYLITRKEIDHEFSRRFRVEDL